MSSKVLLVDCDDCVIGMKDKEEAHRTALLHRAFSVFVFDRNGRLLIQKRNKDKYHSGGLWSNTCCSHPITENIVEEAKMRMREEVGFDCELVEADHIVYYNKFSEDLFEYEYDHILVGCIEGEEVDLELENTEISGLRWVTYRELKEELISCPQCYTVWFCTAVSRVFSYMR